jgi:hypothetical protein
MRLQAKVATQIILEEEVAEVQFNARKEARQMDIIYHDRETCPWKQLPDGKAREKAAQTIRAHTVGAVY